MASPFSGLVLVAGVALTSPTLYAAFVGGTVPLDGALTRLVIVVGITTVAVTLVEWVFQETSAPTESHQELSRRMAERSPSGSSTGAPAGADDAADDPSGPVRG